VNLIFADTFYFLALLNQDDAAHQKARAVSEELTDPILTTAWVLTEVADALAAPNLRQVFLSLMENLRSDPSTTIVPPSHALFEQGLNFYAERPDKDWTLTDCISFVVMQQYGITEALTGDRHFEQAGFRALLR
jgi:predicted nucleic acid-binding protein